MDQPRELAAIEAWMQSAIVGAEVKAATIEETILPSSQLTSEQRLAIYQRAYLARLVECLRAEFPMVCRALGQDLFDEFSLGYLTKFPSTNYTLGRLGERFAEYLQTTCPQDDSATSWYEAVIDLATLEWVTNEVFNGPGVEQKPTLSAADFTPEAWDTLTLSVAPCVRLLELQYPVHEYYRSLRADADAAPPSAARTLLVVSRLEYTVRHHAVTKSQFALLQTLCNGGNLSDAIRAAADSHSGDLDQLAAQLHGWFAWMAAERLVTAAS